MSPRRELCRQRTGKLIVVAQFGRASTKELDVQHLLVTVWLPVRIHVDETVILALAIPF